MITETTSPAPGTPDAKGTPYDPGKHIARQNPRTGRWMPRSPGRSNKGQARIPGIDATVQTPAASLEAGAVSVTPPTTELQTPAPNIGNETHEAATKPDEPLPSFADIEAAAGPATPPASATAATAPTGKASPEDIAAADAQGALAAEILETVTGLITGEPEEARMSNGDRTNMSRVFARWFLQNNWIAVGGFLVAMMVATFFLKTAAKEKTRAKLRALWQRMREKKEKRIMAAGAAASATPAEPAPVVVQVVAPMPATAPRPFYDV